MPPFGGAATVRIAISVFVLFPLIVMLAATSDVPPFASGAARWLGAISYPLYAIHHPLLLMIASRVSMRSGAREAAVAVTLVAAATIVELLYDAPIRKRLLGIVSERGSASDRLALDDADAR
jgi:peptidoglycan/LPS O-acetylase OafA/YrhL